LGNADAWQLIGSASGENIALCAKASDIFGDMADSRTTVDHGFLQYYRSEAEASRQYKYVDLYAIHGSFEEKDHIGKISGDKIHSEGLTFNKKGFAALYGVTINYGSVEGRFDWGTETKSNGWVIAVPLESPEAWGGIQGDIGISALKISSYSAALDCKGIVSKDWANYRGVSEYGVLDNDWYRGYGFAEPSKAGD